MILIRIKDTKVAATPIMQVKGFVLQLDFPKNPIASISRSYPPDNPLRNGGAHMISLRPSEEFGVEDTIFQNVVEASRNGGDTAFISQILYYVQNGILEVLQAPATILTAKQILLYVAP